MEPNIAPLAKRLAEENNVNWRGLSGSGSDGRIIERDVLEYLAKVMAGEESINPTAEPIPDGMESWPEEDVKGFFESQASENSVSDTDTAWPSLTETDTLDQLEKEQQELKKTSENIEEIDAETEAEDLLKKSGVFDLDIEDDSLELQDESSIFESDIFITESDVEFDESILNTAEISDEVIEDVKVEDLSEDVFLLDENTESGELDAMLKDIPDADDDEISNLFADVDDEVKSEDMLIDQQLDSLEENSLDTASDDLFSTEQEEIDEDLASLFVDPDEDELMELGTDGDDIAEIGAVSEEETSAEVFAEAEDLEETSELEDSLDLDAVAEQDIELEESDDDVYNVLSGDEEMQLESDTDEMVELESLEEALDLELEVDDAKLDEITASSDLELSTDELEGLLEDVDEDVLATQEMEEAAEQVDSMPIAAVAGAAAIGAAVVGSVSDDNTETELEVEEAITEAEASEDIVEEISQELEEEIEIEASEEVVTNDEAVEEISEEAVEAEAIEAEAEEPKAEEVEDAEEVEMSEQLEETEELPPLVAASSQVVSTVPSMSYGVLLRRHLDMDKLVDAQEVISAELGSNVDYSAFLLKAAAKAAQQTGLVDANKLGLVNFAGKGISIDAIENSGDSFSAFISGVSKAKSHDIGSDQIELVVADMSALDVDEVVLNAVAPVLSLGRINRDAEGNAKSTLSISGDISIETGAKFMAVVAELLASPIRLLV